MRFILLEKNTFLFVGFDIQNIFNYFYIICFKHKWFFQEYENYNKIISKIKKMLKKISLFWKKLMDIKKCQKLKKNIKLNFLLLKIFWRAFLDLMKKNDENLASEYEKKL